MKTTDSMLVGFDDTDEKDKCVLIVGRKTQGKEARELWKKLTEKRESID